MKQTKNQITPVNLAERFLNRELSLIAFNYRVLQLANDNSIPLLERLKFLCISCSNLDEFFEIRVASIHQQIAFGTDNLSIDGLTPQQALMAIREKVLELVNAQYQVLNYVLIPQLTLENIHFLKREHWHKDQFTWLERYFTKNILPVLSPLGLDPSHPFPRILNKSLNFIVQLDGKDGFKRDVNAALVRAPRSLPRLILLPQQDHNKYEFVFLSTLLKVFIDQLFPGLTIQGCHEFRVTRNSDLLVDEEEVDNLARALQGELLERDFAEAVRLEVIDSCPNKTIKFLTQCFDLDINHVYQCNGPVNLNRLVEIPTIIDRPDLKYKQFTPRIQPTLVHEPDIFKAITDNDILMHHPFDSFSAIIELLKQAARDPNVLAIKQTLYRTDPDAILVKLLIEAARSGKDVTVIVELRARFDEKINISSANQLQEAGVQVVYGVAGYKTHAKMMLIVRREKNQIKRYVHLGTGNYHQGTTKLYTDCALLTCNTQLGEDVHKLFLQLSGLGKPATLKKIIDAPFRLHDMIIAKINREKEQAKQGKKAHIIAKMNSLTEAKVINALYDASQAGVKIDLIVRGACCLKPGVKNLSENIQVRSIIGQFLEHARTYYFYHNNHEEVFLASADWMDRNFFRRIEICFPIENKLLAKRVIEETLLNYLKDNTQNWQLQPNGTYLNTENTKKHPHSAQAYLLNTLCNN